MFFSFAFCTFFKIFHVRLGKKSKSVSFSRVYVCVKAKLTLVIFFYFFFAPSPNSKLKHYVVYKWPTRNQLIAVPCTRRRDYPMFALEERIVRTVRWPADYFAVLTSAVSQCQMLVLVAYKLICLQHIWLSVTHTGCFFKWASPKFAKCWPVRHKFK